MSIKALFIVLMLLGMREELFAQDENDSSKVSITQKALDKGIDLITRSTRDTVLVEKSEEKFLPFEGMIIRTINIETVGFDFSIYGNQKPIVQKVGRIANKLHTNTREKTIRQHLFIKPNQPLNPYKLGDNERFLRDQRFILESRIIVSPVADTDSVDLTVVTRDVFSIGASAGGSFPTAPLLKLYDANLDGRGQGLEFDILYDHDRKPRTGFGLAYSKSSLMGSLADLVIYYTQLNSGVSLGEENEFSTGIKIDRPLVSPYAKIAGGAGWSQNWSQNVDSKPDSAFLDYRYNIADVWAGYNFGSEKATRNRRREFVALRLFDGDFIDKPNQEEVIDERRYNDNKGVLGEFTFYQQDFFKTQYVYGFGRTEDVPSGYNLSSTLGYMKTMSISRPYTSIKLNYKGASKNGSFYELTMNMSTYFRHSIWEDAVIQTGGSYYTQAFSIGKFKMRNSASAYYTQLFNRVTNDWLTIDGNIIPGLRVEELDATQRISLGFESSLYTPWSLIGFRIAPFASYYWAKLKCPSCENQYQNFTGISLGMRIRNENLIFGTMEIKGTFIPNDDEGKSKFAVSFRKNLRFRKSDVYVTKPDLINYN
ncbi:hypothetical protein LV85_03935 [Algoriphagus chordae]|uniref:Uncharacterized protein n=2 Tax=Algoriphagus chordae TaxID=237019 RepID=A0A2W7QJU8_9BACT|nr:hypothetical protein LV85_03935 [Algoriphagus chordae]